MKIGILTYHFPINYGALLQTYALYKYIKKTSQNDVSIINYVPREATNSIFSNIRGAKSLLHNFLVLLYILPLRRKRIKFRRFLQTNLNLTEKCSNQRGIRYEDYDLVMTGSDQVFNPKMPWNSVYYQPFDKNSGQKKIAFSPSFGIHEFTKEFKTEISPLIKDFDYISCREQCGADFLSEIRNEHVENTIDPVFLLNKEAWSEIGYQINYNRKYVLIYDLNGKQNLIRIAQKIAEGRDIIIISNDPLAKLKYRSFKLAKIVIDAGIADFVSYIRFSDIVITDSFHGTAMAIIFRKNFFSFIALEKASSRIYSLLERFGLSNRVIKDINRIPYSEISYDESLIINEIENSKRFLSEALS